MATLSQLPSEVNLAFVAGDTFRIRVRIIDPANAGTPMPIDQHRFAAEIAQSYSGANKVGEFTVEPDPDSGGTAVILTLEPAETIGILSAGGGSEFNGVWDLEVTFPPIGDQTTGDVRTVAKGTVRCVDHISNSGLTP